MAESQFAGTTPTSHNWYVIAYVPELVFGAKVNTPSESILNGPVVIGVTSVLAPVTGIPFRISFVVTFPIVFGTVALGTCVGKLSTTASIGFNTTTVAVAESQFAGTTPTSHNWYVMVYVPELVFGAKVNTPSESILNGPVMIGVTSVLAPVTGIPFRISFIVTFPTIVATVADGSCTAYELSMTAHM